MTLIFKSDGAKKLNVLKQSTPKWITAQKWILIQTGCSNRALKYAKSVFIFGELLATSSYLKECSCNS